MVRHHVAQGSCHVKIAATFFHAYCLRHGDLDVVNIAAVPDGFKDAITEAEHQNVLDCFFAKVMVDAENLLLGQYLADLAVQCFGGIQIVAEWFFKHHAPPVSIFFTS